MTFSQQERDRLARLLVSAAEWREASHEAGLATTELPKAQAEQKRLREAFESLKPSKLLQFDKEIVEVWQSICRAEILSRALQVAKSKWDTQLTILNAHIQRELRELTIVIRGKILKEYANVSPGTPTVSTRWGYVSRECHAALSRLSSEDVCGLSLADQCNKFVALCKELGAVLNQSEVEAGA